MFASDTPPLMRYTATVLAIHARHGLETDMSLDQLEQDTDLPQEVLLHQLAHPDFPATVTLTATTVQATFAVPEHPSW
ncbi:MAG: hypothetical protein DI573_13990 [Microbacterium sp.]|nr:MAG: hypothetical protein DI573_13990 [Microbacterium sp.]